MPNLTSRLSVILDVGKLVGNAKTASAAVKSIGEATKALEKIDALKGMKRGLKEASQAYQVAKQNAAQLAAQMAGVEKASRAQQAAMARAAAAVDRTKAAFMSHGQAVRAANQALAQSGISTRGLAAAEGRLRSQIDATNAAMRRRQAWGKRMEAAGQIGAGIGTGVASRLPKIARDSVQAVVDFDIAQRQQRVFMDLAPEDQARLKEQALKVGQDTKFTNLDVVHAQTAAMQGMGARPSPSQKATAAIGITDAASNFAQMMNMDDLTQASEMIRSYMTAFGKNMTDPVEAIAGARDAANVMLKAAKSGGMSPEDVAQYIKFAGAASNAAGVSPETSMALASVARIGGLRGDEAGVFMRTAANKLSSPTNKGLAALSAAGINYDEYVQRPGSVDKGGLEAHFKRRLGKGFDANSSAAIDRIVNDPKLIGDRGAFTAAITKAVEDQYGAKTKNGTTRASDLQKIARTAGEFHSAMGGKVDSERLFADIFGGKMNYAQAAAFFTDKHGGKAMISAQQFEEMKAIAAKLRAMKDDPNFAERGAKEIQGGVGGDVNRAKGSWETALLKTGEAFDPLIKLTADKMGQALDAYSSASDGVRQLTATVIAATAAVAVWRTALLVGSVFGGAGGGAAAAVGGVAARAAGAAATGAAGGAAATAGGIGARLLGAARFGVLPLVGYGAYDLAERNREGRAEANQQGFASPYQMKMRRAREAMGNRNREWEAGALGSAGEAVSGTVEPKVNTSNIEAAKTKAGEAKQAVDAIGNPVSTNVDSSSISAALQLAQRLNAELSRTGSLAAGAKRSVNGTFADFGVSP